MATSGRGEHPNKVSTTMESKILIKVLMTKQTTGPSQMFAKHVATDLPQIIQDAVAAVECVCGRTHGAKDITVIMVPDSNSVCVVECACGTARWLEDAVWGNRMKILKYLQDRFEQEVGVVDMTLSESEGAAAIRQIFDHAIRSHTPATNRML